MDGGLEKKMTIVSSRISHFALASPLPEKATRRQLPDSAPPAPKTLLESSGTYQKVLVSFITAGAAGCRATATNRPPCASTQSATSPSTSSYGTCRLWDAAMSSPICSGRTAQWKSASPWMPRTVNRTPMSSSSISHRFAKRKLDESVFLGNRLQVSYAPQFESLSDTKEKLEVRRKEVLGRIKSSAGRPEGLSQYSLGQGSSGGNSHHQISSNKREYMKTIHASHIEDPRFSHVPSNKDYFPSESMNATVKLVREKLDKIQSGGDNSNVAAASKKPRVDNRRRI